MTFEKTSSSEPKPADPKPAPAADTASLQQRVENLEQLLERHGIRQQVEDPAAQANDAAWGKKKNGK